MVSVLDLRPCDDIYEDHPLYDSNVRKSADLALLELSGLVTSRSNGAHVVSVLDLRPCDDINCHHRSDCRIE